MDVLTPPKLTLEGDVWPLFTALEEAADVIFGVKISLRAVMSASDRE